MLITSAHVLDAKQGDRLANYRFENGLTVSFSTIKGSICRNRCLQTQLRASLERWASKYTARCVLCDVQRIRAISDLVFSASLCRIDLRRRFTRNSFRELRRSTVILPVDNRVTLKFDAIAAKER